MNHVFDDVFFYFFTLLLLPFTKKIESSKNKLNKFVLFIHTCPLADWQERLLCSSIYQSISRKTDAELPGLEKVEILTCGKAA